jgi:hypothetical protein
MERTVLMRQILEKMIYHGCIGARHTSEDNIQKGFPERIRKEVKKALKELLRIGFVVAKPTSYGIEVSVNPRKTKEIKGFIQQ